MPRQASLFFIIFLVISSGPSLLNAGLSISTAQKVIVIDPGHGATDTGLVSASGITEKEITLKLTKKIAKQLEGKYNVFLTREQDTNPSARERAFIANKQKASLFVSLHLHASSTPSFMVYYFHPPKGIAPKKQAKEAGISWRVLPLEYQRQSKDITLHFLKIIKAKTKQVKFTSMAAPVIVLEGIAAPGILIEPISIRDLPAQHDELEKKLDHSASLISTGIHEFLKNN